MWLKENIILSKIRTHYKYLTYNFSIYFNGIKKTENIDRNTKSFVRRYQAEFEKSLRRRLKTYVFSIDKPKIKSLFH